jgi:hypothetical protein
MTLASSLGNREVIVFLLLTFALQIAPEPLRKGLTKLVNREDIASDSFAILGISRSGYTAGEAAVHLLVSPLGQWFLRTEHFPEGCSEK